ncbi:MAG: VWA domain-containing protein [Gemmataceae bacterium]
MLAALDLTIFPLAILESLGATLAIGAGAASIPVIIHLLNRRRYKVMTWAAMQFLIDAEKETSQKMRLEQLLLLLVRVLMLFLILLAMASVTTWAERMWAALWPDGGAGFVTERVYRSHKIIVIDASLSMEARQKNDKSRFHLAVDQAKKVIKGGQQGDGYSVVLLKESPQWIIHESNQADVVERELNKVRASHGNGNVPAMLSAVAEKLAATPKTYRKREVYFITDLQQSTWIGGEFTGDKRKVSGPEKRILREIEALAETVFVDVGQPNSPNLAVSDVQINYKAIAQTGSSALLRPGQTVPITATIHNYGEKTASGIRVKLLDGRAGSPRNRTEFQFEPRRERKISISPGESQTVTFDDYQFTQAGSFAVQVEIAHESDELSPDNRRAFAVSVKNRVPVLIVNGKQAVDPYASASEYLREALNPAIGKSDDPLGTIRGEEIKLAATTLVPKVISPSEFSEMTVTSLAKYDCLFLADVQVIGGTQVDRLSNYLKGGGGVVISVGNQVLKNLQGYNEKLFSGGKGLLPARLIGIETAPEKYNYFPRPPRESLWAEPPLTLFNNYRFKPSLTRSRFTQYLRADASRAKKTKTILNLVGEEEEGAIKAAKGTIRNTDPLIVMWNPPLPQKKGGPRPKRTVTQHKGRVVLMTSTWNQDWNTWSGSPGFVPFVQELTRVALSGRLRQHSVIVGRPLEEVFLSNGNVLDVTLQRPDGEEEALTTTGTGDMTTCVYTDTDVSGIYRMLLQRPSREFLFAVNTPKVGLGQSGSESDLKKVTKSVLGERLPGLKFLLVGDASSAELTRAPDGEAADSIVRTKLGPIIAQHLLFVALLLMVGEIFLAMAFGHFSGVPSPTKGKTEKLAFPITVAILAGTLLLTFLGIAVHAAYTGDLFGFLPEQARSIVEWWFNIEPPAPGEGRHWDPEWRPYRVTHSTYVWLCGTLIAGAAVMLFFVYRHEGRGIHWGQKILMAGIRIFLILLMLAVMLPMLELRFERQSWPDVILIIDDSLSMGEGDTYRDEEIADLVTDLTPMLKERLKESLPAQKKKVKEELQTLNKQLGGKEDFQLQTKIELLTSRLKKLQAQEALIGSPNWKPSRLQLVQSVLAGKDETWIKQLLKKRKMKVHVYNLDPSGRSQKLKDADGRGIDIINADETDRIEAANAAVGGVTPQAYESRLGEAVRGALDYYRGASISAVVVLTDGVTTRGETLGEVGDYAAQKGVPLYFLGVGDDQEQRDIQIHDLQVQDTVYVYDRLNFEVRVTGKGYKNLTMPVVLKLLGPDGKEKEVVRKIVQVNDDGTPVKITLQDQPNSKGERKYIVEAIPPAEVLNDKSTDPSRLRIKRTVYVQEAKEIKVLFVEGSARYEYRFLKAMLEREKSTKKRKKGVLLKVFLVDADPKFHLQDTSALMQFPFNQAELNKFDVVIFGDVDPKSGKLSNKNLTHLASFVRDHGGGLLMIAGSNFSPHAYKNTPLADVLPITPAKDRTPIEPTERKVGYRLELTTNGRLHPIFRFSANNLENAKILQKLEPMYWWAQKYSLKPLAEVLATHPTKEGVGETRRGGTTKHPLVVQQYVGAGRCMFFGFDGTWRWRYREDEKRYNQFWIQTVRYLSRHRVSRTELRLDRQTSYRQGEPIKITVRFPDNIQLPGRAKQLREGAAIPVKVVAEHRPFQKDGKAGDVEVQTITLGKVKGSLGTYRGVLSQTREGKYRFWLRTPDVSSLQPGGQKPSAEAIVALPAGELDQLRMDREEMMKAAETTGGGFFTLADADQLLDSLPSGFRVSLNAPGPPQRIWNHWMFFILILLLFTAEWILRKRKHLL